MPVGGGEIGCRLLGQPSREERKWKIKAEGKNKSGVRRRKRHYQRRLSEVIGGEAEWLEVVRVELE